MEWKHRFITIAAIVATTVFVSALMVGCGGKTPTQEDVNFECKACGKRFKSDEPPTAPNDAKVCPYCGKKAGYALQTCIHCKYRFVIEPTRVTTDLSKYPCPKCKKPAFSEESPKKVKR